MYKLILFIIVILFVGITSYPAFSVNLIKQCSLTHVKKNMVNLIGI